MPLEQTSSDNTPRRFQKEQSHAGNALTAQGPRKPRQRRSDAGTILFTRRDEGALSWIGQQYAIRLDHLQWLLGRFPGKGAAHLNWISEGAARDVVRRWREGQWARTKRIRADEPLWVWLTGLGLRKVGLAYTYRDIEHASLGDLAHVYAINAVRLFLEEEEEATHWISERQLLQGVIYSKGRQLLHRPDGEMQYADGEVMAIEVELSSKTPSKLAENLMELLRGEAYHRLKATYDRRTARALSRGAQSHYTQIWYFAPPPIRRQVRRVCARLVRQGDLSEQEAERLYVRWYPVVETDGELEQEERENEEEEHLEQNSDKEEEEEL